MRKISIPLSSQTKRLKKLVFTAFLLNIQHYRVNVENKPASSLDVSLDKALSKDHLYTWMVRQVVLATWQLDSNTEEVSSLSTGRGNLTSKWASFK